MSKVLDYIIGNLEDIRNLMLSDKQIKAGTAYARRDVINSKVTFELHERRVSITYTQGFPVMVSDKSGGLIYVAIGGDDLLNKIIARRDQIARDDEVHVRDVFPTSTACEVANARDFEAKIISGYQQICEENGCAPSSAELLAAIERYDAAAQKRGEAA